MARSRGILLGMLAETSLHPGAGQAADVVDLPVSREGATGLPQIPETGLKGALKQWAREHNDAADVDKKLKISRLFGGAEADGGGESNSEGKAGESGGQSNGADKYVGAGELMISTARLLCLPVRRLDGPYAWVTCPYLLERLSRDSRRCGYPLNPEIDQAAVTPGPGDPPKLLMKDAPDAPIYLEEYVFQPEKLTKPEDLKRAVSPLIGAGDGIATRLLDQIAVMADVEFAWFAKYALPVDARNTLDDAKMSQNLWYEETLPPDSLFYSVVLPRAVAAREADEAGRRRKAFKDALTGDGYLQVGGNETVGQGWVQLAVRGDFS